MARVFEGIEITEEFVDDLVEEWHEFHDKMPTDLKTTLAAAKDIPVDIDPSFSLPDTVD